MSTRYENSNSFTTLPSSGIVTPSNFSHSGRNVFHCVFNKNFLIIATMTEAFLPAINEGLWREVLNTRLVSCFFRGYSYAVCVCALSHSVVSDFLRTHGQVPCLAALSLEFFRQEYWSGQPFPTPGHLPNPGIKHTSLLSCVSCIGRRILYHHATWEAHNRFSATLKDHLNGSILKFFTS